MQCFLTDAADVLFIIFESWLVFEIVVTSVLIDPRQSGRFVESSPVESIALNGVFYIFPPGTIYTGSFISIAVFICTYRRMCDLIECFGSERNDEKGDGNGVK